MTAKMDSSDLRVGLATEARTFGPISRTDIAKYQGASGDWSVPHHDDDYARQHGYDGVFSLGMLHAGFLATLATDWLGAANVRRFNTRFRDVGWPGDTFTCTACITRKYEFEGESRVDLELLCTRQTGGIAAEGTATFAVTTR